MNPSIFAALRILSHFWLEEVRPGDLATITALSPLAETLPDPNPATLTDLAVEYQRLFGFNLPPYESVFTDPTVMLLAPATARVQMLYRQADWTPPANARAGAPDHLGLELLALAEIEAKAEAKEELKQLAQQLQTRHLALWAPAFILTLRRLTPHPFYATLADLTLELLLTTLPPNSPPVAAAPGGRPFTTHHSPFTIDPFPLLPPPPVYDREGRLIPPDQHEPDTELRSLVKQLLTPCEAGLFLTREDIARLSRALDLPLVMGERLYMLETLFQLAGQYELVPALLNQLQQLLENVEIAYQGWAEAYPRWNPYAQAWRRRVATSQAHLTELEASTYH